MFLKSFYRFVPKIRGSIARNFQSEASLQSKIQTTGRRPLSRQFWVYTGYSFAGIVAADYVINDSIYTGATVRFLRSLKVAVLISSDYLWLFARHDNTEPNYENLLKDTHLRSANRILDACLANGGLYIKVGQGVAAINHILPPEYTKTLKKLQNECLTSDVFDVRRIFREDFGTDPEHLFQEFDFNPIAAASLAQVFRAKGPHGEDLAVKIQYNDLQKRFTTDIGTIILIQDVIEFFFKNYNFGWIFRDIRKNLEMELDFVHEGKNGERAARDLAKFKYVHVPKIYWNLTRTRVLTTEWIDGNKLDDINWMKKENISAYDVDVKVFNLFSEQIFNTGFVHADPHPGNVFLRKSKSGELEVVLLDHGLYQWVPDNVRHTLCKFWEATVLKDEKSMKEAAATLHIANYKQFAEILFQTPIDLNVSYLKTKLTDADIEHIQQIARTNFNYIMQALKDMPRNLLFVVRNLNTIRAVGREHGDPVDRPKLMARYAQSCLYKNENRYLGLLKWLFRRIRFEYCIFTANLKMFIVTRYIDILHKLGRSPSDSSILNVKVEDL